MFLKLPTGMTAYNEFVDALINEVGPIADRDSLEFVIAAEIQALDPKKDIYTDAQDAVVETKHFTMRLQLAAAKQLAGARFHEIKQKHMEAMKKQAEATAQTAGTSDDQKAN